MKNRILIVVAVLCALGAGIATFVYLNQVKQAYRTSGQFRPVVVAATDIPARTAITEPMVALKEMPAEFVHPDAVADKKNVVGKITSVQITAGEMVLRGRLLQEEEKGVETLAARVPVGTRAIAVAIDSVSGVAGALVPGDRVDVVGTFDVDGYVSTVFLQRILVLAVNVPGGAGPGSEERGGGERTVTLAVTPREAQALTLVAERGTVRLLLRSPKDEGTVSIPVTRLKDLVR